MLLANCKGALFYANKSSPHVAQAGIDAMQRLGWETLCYPPEQRLYIHHHIIWQYFLENVALDLDTTTGAVWANVLYWQFCAW